MLAYPAVLDLSPSTRDLLARVIRNRRKAIGSRWRKAAPGRQALLVLVHLRKRASYAELAAGFGLGVATVYRYVTEAVDLLAGLAGCPDRDTVARPARGPRHSRRHADRDRPHPRPRQLLRQAPPVRRQHSAAHRRQGDPAMVQPRPPPLD